MSKINNVHLEYERLKSLFKSVDPTKAELVDTYRVFKVDNITSLANFGILIVF